jgi:hypothetical protein
VCEIQVEIVGLKQKQDQRNQKQVHKPFNLKYVWNFEEIINVSIENGDYELNNFVLLTISVHTNSISRTFLNNFFVKIFFLSQIRLITKLPLPHCSLISSSYPISLIDKSFQANMWQTLLLFFLFWF